MDKRVRCLTFALVAMSLASCRASIPDNHFSCGDTRDCPPGFGCLNGLCASRLIDSSVADSEASGRDSGPADSDLDTPGVDAGPLPIVLRGGFVSGALSGTSGVISLRGSFDWSASVRGSAGEVTLQGRFR